MIGIAILLDLYIRIRVSIVHSSFPSVRVKVIHRDSPEVPDAPGSAPEIRPDVIDVEVAERRLAHPAESGDNITAHDDRLGDILPDSVMGIRESRPAHILDSADESPVKSFRPGNMIIAEGSEKTVLAGPADGDLVRPRGKPLAGTLIQPVPIPSVLPEDLLVPCH